MVLCSRPATALAASSFGPAQAWEASLLATRNVPLARGHPRVGSIGVILRAEAAALALEPVGIGSGHVAERSSSRRNFNCKFWTYQVTTPAQGSRM